MIQHVIVFWIRLFISFKIKMIVDWIMETCHLHFAYLQQLASPYHLGFSFLCFVSVQDLFNAPAAEQEVKTLFERLDDPVGNVPSQQVLPMAKTVCQVSQILPQWGRHSLGQGPRRVHLVPILHWRLGGMAEKLGKKVAKGSGGLRSIQRDNVPQCGAVKCLREPKM